MLKGLALAFPYLLLLPIGGTAIGMDLSDPTRPSGFSAHSDGSSQSTSSPLTLSLIRLGSAPLAIINGETVRPGQRIGGYRLLSLQATSATLAGDTGSIVLKLSPSLQKSPATRKP